MTRCYNAFPHDFKFSDKGSGSSLFIFESVRRSPNITLSCGLERSNTYVWGLAVLVGNQGYFLTVAFQRWPVGSWHPPFLGLTEKGEPRNCGLDGPMSPLLTPLPIPIGPSRRQLGPHSPVASLCLDRVSFFSCADRRLLIKSRDSALEKFPHFYFFLFS